MRAWSGAPATGFAPRHVAVVENSEAGGVEVEAHAADAASRNGRAHGAAVQRPQEHQVVRVLRPAGGRPGPVLPGDAAADGWHVPSRATAAPNGATMNVVV